MVTGERGLETDTGGFQGQKQAGQDAWKTRAAKVWQRNGEKSCTRRHRINVTL